MSALPLPERSHLGRTEAATIATRLVANVEQVVHGRRTSVELVLCAVLAGGHVLIEDVPGSGKTTLARAVARSLGGEFRRVQGTADLLPADITGSGVWEPDRRRFTFVPGPVFAHVVLVDELNRTPPRTQSAFLEAMDEGAVTVDGERHPLPEPFVVLATQNPLEQYGTYPLPEGQLDRFAVTLSLGPNDPVTERRVVREQLDHPTVDELQAVTTPAQVQQVRAEVRRTHVAENVLDHALRVVEATRNSPAITLGASTRAALTLVRCAQGRALLAGRAHVLPDDIKVLAPPVLGHRLALRDGGAGLRRGQELVRELLASVPVPLAT
ncbi:MAG TPA: MoxR family ATPase [Mycobacteriales bacterium]|nr:MoxR family ATPase [Mycobacteriales bacterium]